MGHKGLATGKQQVINKLKPLMLYFYALDLKVSLFSNFSYTEIYVQYFQFRTPIYSERRLRSAPDVNLLEMKGAKLV